VEAHAAICVARRCKALDPQASKVDHLIWLQLHVCSSAAGGSNAAAHSRAQRLTGVVRIEQWKRG
jgi:hypothetical protein